MADTMNAVLNYAPNDYRLERIPIPKIGTEEVLIKIDAAGICGSDGKCFHGAPSFWDKWVQAPVVPGHEFYGTVVELGPGAGEKFGIKTGDKIIAEQIYPCDRCRYCQRGQYWMCEVHDMYGFQKHCNGAWAEYMKLGSRSRIHKMPADIKMEDGVLVEPLACAIHAVERGEIQLGDTVVLAGVGTLGSLMLQIVKLKNPGQIIVADAKPERLEMARALRRHPHHQRQGAGRGGRGEEAHRRLRHRRLHRGDRLRRRGGAGPGHDAQARHLRLVRRLRREGRRRLVDHRRPQGAEHPRRAPRALLLPEGHRLPRTAAS